MCVESTAKESAFNNINVKEKANYDVYVTGVRQNIVGVRQTSF